MSWIQKHLRKCTKRIGEHWRGIGANSIQKTSTLEMFGFFKKKKESGALALVLRLDDKAFVSFVKNMLEESHPAAWTMCVVAYQNLQPMLQACEELAKEEKFKDVPADLDSFIRMLSARLEENLEEIPKRRLSWFYQAALIRRATEIAAQKNDHQSTVAALWIMLAKGSATLSELLPPNALWSDDEKAYFADIKSQRDGIWYCLQILTPDYLKKDKSLISFAESQDITLLPM